MYEKRIEIGEGQHLTLSQMAGTVRVSGWGESDVLFRVRDGEEQDLTIEETAEGPAVSARRDCEVQVPAAMPVKVRQARANLVVEGLDDLAGEQVRGNLKLSDVKQAAIAEVHGNLHASAVSSLQQTGTTYGTATLKDVETADLQNVRGSLVAKAVGRLRASLVGGTLQAKGIRGPLEAEQVGGNATLKGIEGTVTLEQVAGNLVAKSLAGGARIPKIGGNLVLNGALGQGRTYQFNTRGNATLRLEEGSSAHMTLSAGGIIKSSVALAEERREGNTLTGTMGDGGAEVVVEARGNILLGGGEPAIRIELGEEISRQVEESLAAIDLGALGAQASEELNAAMSRLQVKLESVDWDRIGAQTQQAIQRAMEHMQRDMDRMVEKAERQQERLQRKLEREAHRRERVELRRQRVKARRHAVEVTVDEWAADEAEEDYEPAEQGPDLDEERLTVLRMVERGQITPEEGEMLLDALQEL
jgi:hypothetical protein